MSNKPDFLLWCDLETTGLNPETDSILEMALIMTTPDLEEIGRKHSIFKSNLNLEKINPHVIEMHSKNGLWLEVINKGISKQEVDWETLYWIDKLITPEGEPNMVAEKLEKVYLAGSSVHFDRKFLDLNFYFHKNLSHRIVDVSVIRTIVKMWGREDLMWPQNDTHRAMDDILDHIEELKHYRRVLGLEGLFNVYCKRGV